ATESDVDISGAHPYWAYPFGDVAVVHNGQLTNYFQWKHRLERSGHRFQSECDSEVIAVYLAQKMSDGYSLEDAMRESLEDIDGEKAVFDAKDLTTRKINLELRWLLYEQGVKDVTVLNPGAKHSLGVGILTRCKITFDGSLGYFGCGVIDGPEIHIKGRVGWS